MKIKKILVKWDLKSEQGRVKIMHIIKSSLVSVSEVKFKDLWLDIKLCSKDVGGNKMVINYLKK